MPQAVLTFDPALHEYRVGGRVLPSVTQVLKETGLIKTDFFTTQGQDRGSIVHLACQWLDEGTLDRSSIDPAIEGYIKAYESFLEVYKPKWQSIEKPLANSLLGFAGTPDRIESKDEIFDIKTGSPIKATEYQLSAYHVLAYGSGYMSHKKHFGLYLMSTGKFALKATSNLERDWNVFRAALTVYHAKKENL